jgi:hypothetical protein
MHGKAIYPVYLSIQDLHVTIFSMLLLRARMLANGKDDERNIAQAKVDAIASG